ncbi:hypothetical protein RhiirA1_492391 [Rhizophagus irregularis]|uniref:Protein kinase domain-containing protein n=1 Tax=Rhizophagus irregularis TaxID=588596 RepID=A0A2N0R8N7_9GLOM|nr:hypothetical protein RhiirA1_492391 [Rhizophagus irregularis]
MDNFIKHTQLHASESVDYLEYVNFDQFDLIENTNKGGAFSTIYSAVWMEGPRWVWDEDAEQWTRNGPIKVALKRLNNSQNISEEYFKQLTLKSIFVNSIRLVFSPCDLTQKKNPENIQFVTTLVMLNVI